MAGKLFRRSRCNLYHVTPIEEILATTSVKNGQAIAFSRQTTTALTINEREERLLKVVKNY